MSTTQSKPKEYGITATSRKTCCKCEYWDDITVSLPGHSIEDFSRYVEDEINSKMANEGWLDGHCPDCSFAYGDRIAAAARADDARKEMECDQ